MAGWPKWALHGLSSFMVAVHGASQVAEVANSIIFKKYIDWMCEEQPGTLAELDRQQEWGETLANKLSGLLFHQAIADLPPEAADQEDKWWKAAQYQDRMIPDRDGRGGFDYYFICLGKDSMGEKCYTVTAASAWKRKKEDPLATKQAWYCPICGCRYKTTFGTL